MIRGACCSPSCSQCFSAAAFCLLIYRNTLHLACLFLKRWLLMTAKITREWVLGVFFCLHDNTSGSINKILNLTRPSENSRPLFTHSNLYF